MTLSQSAESYSRLKNEWKKRWVGRSIYRIQCMANRVSVLSGQPVKTGFPKT